MNYLLQPVHLTPVQWMLFILLGIITGVINTLAGSGSLITLPLLMFVGGLPAPIANATNRVGILIQGMVGVYGFNKAGNVEWKGMMWYLLPMLFGAVGGALLAAEMNELVMKICIGALMLLMLILLLVRPERWLVSRETLAAPVRHLYHLPIFFMLGVYGGFIQAGMGMITLAVLVLMAGLDLNRANGIKLVAISALNVPAFLIFLFKGQIHLGLGLILAVSQALGAWLAVRWMVRYKEAQVWTYYLLVVLVLFSGARIAWDIWSHYCALR